MTSITIANSVTSVIGLAGLAYLLIPVAQVLAMIIAHRQRHHYHALKVRDH